MRAPADFSTKLLTLSLQLHYCLATELGLVHGLEPKGRQSEENAPKESAMPKLGIIEGYFGPAWSWSERAHVVRNLARVGYEFFLYAPKADAHLRRNWRKPHDLAGQKEIHSFRSHCADLGVAFGIGLTPFGLQDDGADISAAAGSARQQLQARIRDLNAFAPDYLAILFDDMNGNIPGLAQLQAQWVEECANVSSAKQILFCPTFYSQDPILDRVFGQRPSDYLSHLSSRIARNIGFFWTGPEVCSREISPSHLRAISRMIDRPLWLWDNYPVNDGPIMSNYLHLRGFTGRLAIAKDADRTDYLAAHAINPALQPLLSCLPARSLAALYRDPDQYDYAHQMQQIMIDQLGAPLATRINQDWSRFCDHGLTRIAEQNADLIAVYAHYPNAEAKEICRWLQGDYAVSREMVLTQ